MSSNILWHSFTFTLVNVWDLVFVKRRNFSYSLNNSVLEFSIIISKFGKLYCNFLIHFGPYTNYTLFPEWNCFKFSSREGFFWKLAGLSLLNYPPLTMGFSNRVIEIHRGESSDDCCTLLFLVKTFKYSDGFVSMIISASFFKGSSLYLYNTRAPLFLSIEQHHIEILMILLQYIYIRLIDW